MVSPVLPACDRLRLPAARDRSGQPEVVRSVAVSKQPTNLSSRSPLDDIVTSPSCFVMKLRDSPRSLELYLLEMSSRLHKK
jgi:hypothetical protein